MCHFMRGLRINGFKTDALYITHCILDELSVKVYIGVGRFRILGGGGQGLEFWGGGQGGGQIPSRHMAS